jgi:hypothetical protein
MRGILVQHPLEYRLEVQSVDALVQGGTARCALTIRNHGEQAVQLASPTIQMVLANLKKVKAKDLSGFEDLSVTPLVSESVTLEPKSVISLEHTFELDRNAPISDKTQTIYLLYGASKDRAELGQLALTISPHPHLRAIFDTFTSVCSFVSKAEGWKDGRSFARLKAPDSRRMSFVDELCVWVRDGHDALEVEYVFSVKKFDTTMTKVDVKKGKTEIKQQWPRAEYLFGGDFLNQQYVEAEIDAALANVSSGL